MSIKGKASSPVQVNTLKKTGLSLQPRAGCKGCPGAPDAKIIIVADCNAKSGKAGKTGLIAAMDAAFSIKAKVATPDLGRKADAWDQWNEQGAEGIKAMLADARIVTSTAGDTFLNPRRIVAILERDDVDVIKKIVNKF